MNKYQKKPVIVEAMQCIEPNKPHDLAAWCGGEVQGVGDMSAKMWINVPTLHGITMAHYGDWIVKSVKGDFYPCRSDIFDETHEKV